MGRKHQETKRGLEKREIQDTLLCEAEKRENRKKKDYDVFTFSNNMG